MKHPTNEASEKIHQVSRHWFFAVEHTPKTSPVDIEDFSYLLNALCKRYNLRWSQAIWKEDLMERLK